VARSVVGIAGAVDGRLVTLAVVGAFAGTLVLGVVASGRVFGRRPLVRTWLDAVVLEAGYCTEWPVCLEGIRSQVDLLETAQQEEAERPMPTSPGDTHSAHRSVESMAEAHC
jgi:hypothetical protein